MTPDEYASLEKKLYDDDATPEAVLDTIGKLALQDLPKPTAADDPEGPQGSVATRGTRSSRKSATAPKGEGSLAKAKTKA